MRGVMRGRMRGGKKRNHPRIFTNRTSFRALITRREHSVTFFMSSNTCVTSSLAIGFWGGGGEGVGWERREKGGGGERGGEGEKNINIG